MNLRKWAGCKNLDINKVRSVLENLDTALVIVKSRRKENNRKVRYKDYLTITNNRVRENTGIFKEFSPEWSNAKLNFKMMFNAYDPSWINVSDYLSNLEDDYLSVYEIVIVYSNSSTNISKQVTKITYKNI